MKKPLRNLKELFEGIVSRFTEVSIDSGAATGGTQTTIVDVTKGWEANKWKEAIIEVEVDGVNYYRTCSGNDATTLTISALPAGKAVAAGDHYNIRLSTRIVTISGQAVKISGQTVIAKVSGQIVYVSGQPVKISGQTVVAETSVSGNIVYVSGQPVKVSGQTVVAKVSGQIVYVSGQPVKVSGQTVIAKVSGEIVGITVPTAVVHFQQTIPDAATQLTSGTVKAATVKALTDNSGYIYLGDSDVSTANGQELAAGEAQSADIDDTSRFYAIAQVSGDKISVLGVN